MFARVIATQVAPDILDSVIRDTQEQLPAAQSQRGFNGFYLLTSRDSGTIMTISLWETHDDVQAVEAQAAQIRSKTAAAAGVRTPAVDIYEVAVQA